MNYTLDKAIAIMKPYISKFFNPDDDAPEIYYKEWNTNCIWRYFGGKLVGAFSNDNRFVMFQFRELTAYTKNYTCGYPEKAGFKGDIIVEISYAPHQSWRFYNLSNPEDVVKLKQDIAKVA